ncbi:hypothetical protein AXZ77_3041 [Thioclava sp. ES.031]|uniref:hypothetical protein n=1 Tax=Thioclava sp. ES.031 TaxID=1798203 RepID=UPI000BF277A8|nr:hypothetical protein [Thioclava sp. ES.031]PFG64402.1 hypothetical protein AXZ77_3041 [Thioclava sp. ES.031]
MDAALWGLNGVFVSAQLLIYSALLIWPPGIDLRSTIDRFELWQGSGILAMQVFFAVPLMSALIWRTHVHRQTMILISLSFLATAVLGAAAWLEMGMISGAVRDAVNERDLLRGLALLRWGEFATALAAAIALRLAWVARSL